jgi:hypothetical protein
MRRIIVRILVALLVLATTGVILLVGTMLYGHVSGEEFAPDTFEHRAYHYYELPVVRMQITPVRRELRRSTLAQTLVDKKFIPCTTPPRRWDLVVSRRMGEELRQGDAQILSQYLDVPDDRDESHWLQWTEDHPAVARILWPVIAKLAQQELYLFTPELFELAAEQSDPEAFSGDLKRILARRYEELAELEVELSNFAAAVRFFTEALSYEPQRESSVRGRAQAQERLGRSAGEEPDPSRSSVSAEENPAT